MSKTKGFLLAVAVAAMGFTFSCSSDDDGGGGGGGEKGNDIGNYKTVVIGTQTWMAENLNYAVEGSKCFGEDGEVLQIVDWEEMRNGNPITKTLSNAEVQANCNKYGRLYDWATAMALPPSCNENSCSSQVQPKHKGICPSGWHIPSIDDWEKLLCYVANENGFSLYDEYGSFLWAEETLGRLGRYLKATSGWNDNGNGTDQYGFSALPGGVGIPLSLFYGNDYPDYFYGVVDIGYWWSASEQSNGHDADRYMAYGLEDDHLGDDDDKPYMFSVRCVKDVELPGGSSGGECGKPSSSSVPSSSSSGGGDPQSYNYCIYIDAQMCLVGPYKDCLVGGIPSNSCPYGGEGESSSSAGGEVLYSSGGLEPSSSSTGGENPQSYSYCVWPEFQACFHGPYTSCPVGTLSNSCPFGGGGEVSSSSSFTYSGRGNSIYNYRTVTIGTQTWMAENLDYTVEGSKCYNNDPDNCQKYGQLYDWETAKTVCPSGWHLPTLAEWDVMTAYIGGASTEGKKLKATSGWNDYNGVSGNGTDEYGFSALPGGAGHSDGSFIIVGDLGIWWSASEYDGNFAYSRYMDYGNEDAIWYDNDKSILFSVRCLQD